MKTKLLSLLLILLTHQSILAQEEFGNLVGCDYIDLTDQNEQGSSFLALIQGNIKPELDDFAIQGYAITNGDRLVETLDIVDKKVKRQVLSSLRGEDKKANLKKIGDSLEGEFVTLYNLPGKLAKFKFVKDRYKLSTYIGLTSCGGSTLKLADDNYAYNIHYGAGNKEKDKQTGRSFGASRIFNATDASYSHYLRTLESYVRSSQDNVPFFTKTIMETLTNSNPRGYEQVNDHGDAVLTDFFAIWTAEQTRNIMDNHVSLHWDAALLQVTLLSAFHAGQDKIKLFYKDPLSGKTYFTDKTYNLAWPKKNHKTETCDVDLESRNTKPADLKDYIGVHYRMYKHCGRSGINMSRNEWKKLSRNITAFLMNDKKGKSLIKKVRSHISDVVDLSKNEKGKKYKSYEKDVLRELARFLINDETPKRITNWEELSHDTTELLDYIRIKANKITAKIEKEYPGLPN